MFFPMSLFFPGKNYTIFAFFIPLTQREILAQTTDILNRWHYNLEAYIKLIEDGLTAYDFGHKPQKLYEPIRYVISLGGKRLRPVLTLMACHLFDDNYQKALSPALAIEVFHNFTLLHDDIMDKAPLRRGSPTVHEKWDENTAILSGDVMLIKAYELFLDVDIAQLKSILKKFNTCAAEVCEGQQLDMIFETVPTVTEAEYIEMIRLKTAVLLAFSLEAGAIIGGAHEAERNKLYEFGMNIGIGFQLKDDLLDVYADSAKFGKQVGGDIISNKKTYLLIKALELANGASLKELNSWGSKVEFDPVEKVNAVKNIYSDLGIKEFCESKMNQYFSHAFSLFDAIEADSKRKQPLSQFASTLIEREK
jgi:geranylgeranyl diphosphate synthase, type II